MAIKSVAIAIVLMGGAAAYSSQALGDVLYTNGPINGTLGAYTISSGQIISDSFVLAQDSPVARQASLLAHSFSDGS